MNDITGLIGALGSLAVAGGAVVIAVSVAYLVLKVGNAVDKFSDRYTREGD